MKENINIWMTQETHDPLKIIHHGGYHQMIYDKQVTLYTTQLHCTTYTYYFVHELTGASMQDVYWSHDRVFKSALDKSVHAVILNNPLNGTTGANMYQFLMPINYGIERVNQIMCSFNRDQYLKVFDETYSSHFFIGIKLNASKARL